MIWLSTQIWALPSGSRLEGRQGSLRLATAGGNQVCFPADQRIHPQEVEVREREARSPPTRPGGRARQAPHSVTVPASWTPTGWSVLRVEAGRAGAPAGADGGPGDGRAVGFPTSSGS